MVLLPHGNPVKENVNPGKVKLPDALDKLCQGKFMGCLRSDFTEGTGIFISGAHWAGFHDSLAKAATVVAGPGNVEPMLSETKKGARTLFRGP
jgi:hypothetical protein